MRLFSTVFHPTLAFLVGNRHRCFLSRQSKRYSAFAGTSSLSSTRFQTVASISEIADLYDGFILDQFGVLHDGVHPLPGAIECIEYLHRLDKKLMVLSNTSAPSHKALERLEKLGFDRRFFAHAVTSGEEASRYIRTHYGSDDNNPCNILFWTWDAQKPNNPRLTAHPQAFLDQCGNVRVVDTVSDADLIVLHGSEVWYRGPSIPSVPLGNFIETGNFQDLANAMIHDLLHECIRYDLPMVCANPDVVVATPDGGTAYMPGGIALHYRHQLGGNLFLFGKPDRQHFDACVDRFHRDFHISRDRILHVGDSLCHDIQGAHDADIASLWITETGIHAKELQHPDDSNSNEYEEDLDVILQKHQNSPRPTHIVPAFRL
jgi:ribonucleotide monophosphatase NagD (HAD superfamily)